MSDKPPIECFGLHWDPNNVRCKGGLDPTWTNQRAAEELRVYGRTKIPLHKRDRCVWEGACSSRTGATRLSQQQVMQPTRYAPPPLPQQFHTSVRQVPQPQQSLVQWAPPRPHPLVQNVQNMQNMQHMQQPPLYHPGQMVHPAMAAMPMSVPMNYPAPGMQAPAFLTVPEPIIPGQSLTRPFFATMGRTILKALGMSAANWFDHVSWNSHANPYQQYPPPNYSDPNQPPPTA